MTAASQRLGEEGALNASRAASSGRRMELPGIGRKHQAGLDEMARSFIQVREGMTLSKDWERRVEREAQEAEKVAGAAGRARAPGADAGAGAGPRAAERRARARVGPLNAKLRHLAEMEEGPAVCAAQEREA